MPPNNEQSPLLMGTSDDDGGTTSNNAASTTRLQSLFEQPTASPSSHEDDGLLSTSYHVAVESDVDTSSHKDGQLLYEDFSSKNDNNKRPLSSILPIIVRRSSRISLHSLSTTITGSVVFAIYHTVFCLAMSSSILRPHCNAASANSTVGSLAKLAALGVLTAGPTFVWQLGDQVPAIYPAADLFLAPFLAQIAERIDAALFEKGLQNDDTAFLATFVVLTSCFGLVLSGALCLAAARIKLANLGLFLPYSVLCGFFGTVGILMWTLGFSVDTGQKVGTVLFSKDGNVVSTALLHHAPSVVIGITMHLMGRQHPFWVISIMVLTVLGSYFVMWVTGTSLEAATEAKWFFSVRDLVPQEQEDDNTLLVWDTYGPPLPMGSWVALIRGDVVWDAAIAALPPVLSLAFLYLIRCSVQAAALKKNIRNVTRKKPSSSILTDGASMEESFSIKKRRQHVSTSSRPPVEKKQKPPLTLNFMLEHGYGYSQIAAALFGGISVAPAVAASLTLFHLGAEKPAPQYGSCLLMLVLYLTDFRLVQYIPKPAFSCLMILASIDMCRTWLVGSYLKTKAKVEWMVAPILVVLAFTVGMLKAILFGVAISTFIFAANFYRAGTVKFVGTGRILRSTIERGVRETEWLDAHADMIQILVLSNYLFFGNVHSVATYVQTMFEDVQEEGTEEMEQPSATLLPKPSVVVIDFALVSGFDTSAIDQFRDIIDLCRENHCKLMLAGLGPSLKSNLVYAGLKPEGGVRSRFAYMSDLESALVKAEDILISDVLHLREIDEKESQQRQRLRSVSTSEDGFAYALLKIEQQHGLNVSKELEALSRYATLVEVKAGETLIRHGSHYGLYFIETGLMQITPLSPGQSAVNTASVSALPSNVALQGSSMASIGQLNARSDGLGPQAASWVERQRRRTSVDHSSRLAKIGQGWVIGCIETSERSRLIGKHVAISDCRLHHLSQASIQQIEKTDPTLAMNLYKLISLLATKRQEATIHQLEQFVKVMKSPVPRLRGGRRELSQLSISQYNT